jgi:hypothetical protein
MADAEQMATALRRDFGNRTGTETTDTATFDVVLAHLRVPETV